MRGYDLPLLFKGLPWRKTFSRTTGNRRRSGELTGKALHFPERGRALPCEGKLLQLLLPEWKRHPEKGPFGTLKRDPKDFDTQAGGTFEKQGRPSRAAENHWLDS